MVHAASRPHVDLLGRIPGTRRFSDRERHRGNELIPNVGIFRPESGFVYFNIDRVRDIILNKIYAEPVQPRLVVLDLSGAIRRPAKRTHACRHRERLTAKGIRFQAAEARSSVRDRLRYEGVDRNRAG